jgi:hypothetical protein
MIKKISSIDNLFLKHNYLEMVDSMFEHVADIRKGFGRNVAKKAKRVSLIDANTFNFFGMYSKEIYTLYKEIASVTKDLFTKDRINFERSFPYLYGRLLNVEALPIGVALNFAPNFRTAYWGLYIISSNNDKMILDEEDVNLEPGTLIIVDSQTKAVFNKLSDNFMAVVINISPLEYLHRQYYQKWIPIL